MEMIDAGAEDVYLEDGIFTIYTSMEDFGKMNRRLEELKIEVENTELQRIPKTTVSVDVETAKRVFRFIEAIEEDDDVQAVYHTMELTDMIIAEL